MDWTVDVCRSAELQVIQNKSDKMMQEELAKLEHELEQLMIKRNKASERMQTLLAEHDAAEQAIQEMAKRDEATGRIIAEIFDEHDDSKISLLNEEDEKLVWSLLWIEGELIGTDDDLEQVNREIALKQRVINSRQKIQGEIESLHAANTLEKYINKSSVGQLVHTESIHCERYYCIDFNGKHLRSKDLKELRQLVANEEDRMNQAEGYASLTNRRMMEILRAKNRMNQLSAAESMYVLEMFYQAVFGEKEEREAARIRIYDTLRMHEEKADNTENDAMKDLLQQIQEEEGADIEAFQKILGEYMDKRQMSQQCLGMMIGCSKSNITKFKRKVPKRIWVLRMALALEMLEADLKRFLRSAGYSFPSYDSDQEILKCIRSGIHDYRTIRSRLKKDDYTL